MTIPAVPVRSMCHENRCIDTFFPVLQESVVASKTVLLNDMFALFPDKYYLGFSAQGEDCGMPQPVLGLEKIFVQDIVMRDMAIVAMC
jgi:hypothetical protein